MKVMKFPTLTLSLLIICSIVCALPFPPTRTTKVPTLKAANEALNPSISSKVTALLTGNNQPGSSQQFAKIKNTNSVAVRNDDGVVFTVDKSKPRANSIYEAENHSDPNSPIVMKESITKGSFNPDCIPRNLGELPEDYRKRLQTLRLTAINRDQEHAKAEAEKEKQQNYYCDGTQKVTKSQLKSKYNGRMGISAGKPVVVADGYKTTTYIPMKVEGESLRQEFLRPSTDPNYISSHTLVENAKNAIIETNKNGIAHNDARPGNIMVTRTGGKMVNYGKASEKSDKKVGTDTVMDHRRLATDLYKMKGNIPFTRMDSFKSAMNKYFDQVERLKVIMPTIPEE